MDPQPTPAVGSHLWHLAFISFAVVLILFGVIRGWNRGIARQMARLGGLIAGSLAVYFGAAFVVPVMRAVLDFPDPALWLLAALVLFLVTYLAVNGTGAVLFKRTKDYDSPAARLM